MKPYQARKMLKLMELPGTAQLITDGMRIAVNSCGIDLSDEQLVKFLTVLDRKYRDLLPVEKKPEVVQTDLDDLIAELKQVYPKQFKDYGKEEGDKI